MSPVVSGAIPYITVRFVEEADSLAPSVAAPGCLSSAPNGRIASVPALKSPLTDDDGPVRPQRWEQKWPIASGTARLARLHAQTRLAVAAWPGDRTVALRVVTELVQNAVEHVGAGEVLLVLFLDETEDLVLEVADQEPEFTDFQHAIAAQKQTGLSLVRALGGDVSLQTPPAGFGKSVRVVLHPLAV